MSTVIIVDEFERAYLARLQKEAETTFVTMSIKQSEIETLRKITRAECADKQGLIAGPPSNK